MAEIRIDPLTGEFIIVNDKRMERPVITSQLKSSPECPFCANSSKRHPGLPFEYESISVENLYPSLVLKPDQTDKNISELRKGNINKSMPNMGKCEVLLYSSDHNLEFYNQSKILTTKIMKLWKERVLELQKNTEIKYIFIFENRGSAVGVTILHPHGQLYALPFIPPIVKKMLKNHKKFYSRNKECLMCSIIENEKTDGKRMILENKYFIAFVPYSAKLLFEVQIVPTTHHETIVELQDEELEAFGSIIQAIRKKYDLLFKNKKASFMMMLYNAPVNTEKKNIFHFYLQFVCLDRDDNNFKYRASAETGLYLWTNDAVPEKVAEEFRTV